MFSIDDYVIGQKTCKKVLSVAVHNHYKRLNYENKTSKNVELSKIKYFISWSNWIVEKLY